MEIKMDSDVKKVVEFMQRNVRACKLVGVAEAVASIAGVIWGQYERDEFRALYMQEPPINPDAKVGSSRSPGLGIGAPPATQVLLVRTGYPSLLPKPQ